MNLIKKVIYTFKVIKSSRNGDTLPNCAFGDCPKYINGVCCDGVPLYEDCCWFLRWARKNYK